MSEEEKQEVNTAQLDLSKLLMKWGKQDPSLQKVLKKESRKSFDRSGLKIIEGGDNDSTK